MVPKTAGLPSKISIFDTGISLPMEDVIEEMERTLSGKKVLVTLPRD